MTIFELTFWGLRIAPTYYGLAYAIGFLGAYWWIRSRNKFSEGELDVLLYSIMAGIILGGRLGYVVFYNFSYYLNHPSKILAVWEGGMSFHGGIIGVILAIFCYSKYMKKNIWSVADEVAVTVPLGIFVGRIANFLNNELYGYSGYHGPFAMVHQNIGHFPSPLMESLLEGLILGLVLIILQKKQMRAGLLASFFLIGYSIARIITEVFFRLPDPQIGYLLGGFSMGAWLSFLALAAGIGIALFIVCCKGVPNHQVNVSPKNGQ